MKESASQVLIDQAKLELEARHPQATRLATSRHTRLRDRRLVPDMQLANMQLANMGIITKREWLEQHPFLETPLMGRAALNTLETQWNEGEKYQRVPRPFRRK